MYLKGLVHVVPLSLKLTNECRYNANGDENGNLRYESTLPVTTESGDKCSGVTEAKISYEECGFDDNYDAFIRSVENNMLTPEGLVVRPRTRAAYLTSKKHMLADGIPAWAKRERDVTQTFVDTLMNKTMQVCVLSP